MRADIRLCTRRLNHGRFLPFLFFPLLFFDLHPFWCLVLGFLYPVTREHDDEFLDFSIFLGHFFDNQTIVGNYKYHLGR